MNLTDFSHLLQIVASTETWPFGMDLEGIVSATPGIGDLPLSQGQRVLVRADLDLPLKSGVVQDESRLDACLPTVVACMDRGCRTILFGHIGRDPEKSLGAVAKAWSQRLGKDVPLISDWFDESAGRLAPHVNEALDRIEPGGVAMLENCRRYRFETAAWGKSGAQLDEQAPSMHAIANAIAEGIASTLIIECIAASNFDFSSSILPLAMRSVGLGAFLRNEMLNHVARAMKSDVLLMSGLKSNKLDDFEQIVTKRPVRLAIVGGALAMPLLKARANASGVGFELGRVGTDTSLPSYVPPDRIQQAERIVANCRAAGIELVLPIDFVLEDGTIATEVPSNSVQLDIGPDSLRGIEAALQSHLHAASRPLTAFVNGAVGMYEDDRYSAGTRGIVEMMQRLNGAGLRVFVGGGDGRAAFERFGDLDKVTYAFTSGGTILKLLADKSINFLNAAYLLTRREAGSASQVL